MRLSHRRRGLRRLGWVLLSGSLLLSLATGVGCTRRFFRRRADAEVDAIFHEKDKYPQWPLDDFYVYPNPLARHADWTNPDRPPMPPDDPAAWNMSPHPQRPWCGPQYIEGTGYLDLMSKWDKENRARKEAQKPAPQEATEGDEPLLPGETKTIAERTREIDNQIERELNSAVTNTRALPEDFSRGINEDCKPFLLDLNQTVELGFLNSREWQTVRENLYLTALPVTAQRFAFIAQPFVTEQVIRERSGRASVDGKTNRWIFNTTTGFTKLFSTGALLLLNFANQTVYNLGKSGKLTSVSTLNFDFVQPFLAGGGRAVALEPLTQSERDLLYAIRDFVRLRQNYYTFFAAGQGTFIPGVQAGVVAISASTVGSAAPFIPGPTPLTLSTFNPATPQVTPSASLNPILGSGPYFPTPQGYLSAIAERSVLVNSYKNIQALQRFLRLFEIYLEGGIVNLVQKNQIEQTLLRSLETVFGNQASYRISLDQLKQQLGVPMTIPIELDPAPLQPMIDLTDAFEQLSVDSTRVYATTLRYGRMAEAGLLRDRLRRQFESTPLLRGTRARTRILERWAYWQRQGGADRRKFLLAELEKLRKELDALRQKRATLRGEPLPEADQRRLADVEFEIDMVQFEADLSYYEQQPWRETKDPILQQAQQADLFRRVARGVLALADRAVAERQDRIRQMWPALPALCAEGVDLLETPENKALPALERTAITNRLDLMNVRAQLVDAWRKIRVTANALLGTFTVDYHLDTSSPPFQARPFALGGSRTRHELIFNMSPPIVRVVQRNNYRSTLINYQQLRRNLMLYEDQILFEVRLDLRQLRSAANNYQRVQKRQIELAYTQVDQALEAFSQPQAPPGADIQGLIGPTAARPQVGDPAALTQQLLNAQSSLLSAQNDLYNTWIGYLNTRMALYRDMGVMRFDNRGVWIDDTYSSCDCGAGSDSSAAGTGDQQRQRPSGGPEQLPPPGPEQLPAPKPEPTAAGPALGPRS